MTITRKWLETNASSMSFERGESLAETQDIEVSKMGLTYHAKVYGERAYHVEIQDTGTEPIASCTCPFDWGGICKHIVAVGLTIIKGEYEAKEESVINVTEEKPNYMNASIFLEKTFLKADIQTQHAFLRQLFTQNPAFITQFDAFTKAEASPVDVKNIDNIAQKVCKAFSKIPLDLEKMYNRYDSYDDEDDGTDWAKEKLEKKFSSYHQQGQEILKKGDLMAFLTFQAGVYEGLIQAEEPVYNDNYGEIFEDYTEILQEIFSEHLAMSFPVIEKMIIQDATANACSDLLLDRADFYYKSDKLCAYDFRDWEAFWLYLIQSDGAANHLLNRLKHFSLYLPEIPRLVMKAAKIVGDIETWAATAEAYSVDNKDISLEILNYYQHKQDIQGIVNVVNKIFTQAKYPDTTLLLKYITPQADKALYLSVLASEVRNKHNLSLYRQYAEIASLEQKNALISSIKTDYNVFFYAQVLAEEKEYDKVLGLMGNVYREKDVPQMLKLVVPYQTEKAWEWTKKFATERMENSKRSRDLYNALAQCIALFLPISTHKLKAKTLATGLIGMYPRMTALREELKKANLL